MASEVWGLRLPLVPLSALVALTILSNLALGRMLARGVESSTALLAGVLALDTGTLGGLLALSGGAANPFGLLLLVHVAIAAFALELWRATLLIGFTALVYAGLSMMRSPVTFDAHPDALRVGGWVAFALTAAALTLVVSRLQLALRDRQHALASLERSAARAETLASMGALAAGAAHELNTPLGTIAIAARELETLIDEEPEQAIADAALIREEVERCRAILGAMSLRAGEASAEKVCTISARAILERLEEHLAPQDRPRLRIESPEDLSFEAPVLGLVHVLASLVRNGLQATPRAAGRVGVRAEADGERVRFVVEDEGVGIAPSVVHDLGEAFVSTKADGGGLGLGVFLGRRFAEMCGGSLEIASERGRGTRVVLELPRRMETSA